MELSTDIKREISRIRKLAESAGLEGGKLSSEFLFSIVAANLLFFNNEIKKTDILDGFVDGSGDGGIDFLHNDENNLYFIQSKTNQTVSYEMIQNALDKMNRTLIDLREQKYKNFNDQLVSNYLNIVESFNQEYDVVFYFVGSSEISNDIKDRVLSHFAVQDDVPFKVEIIDGIEILEEIERYKYTQITVENGFLKLDKSKNYLNYDEQFEGVICNIRASSLKELYNKEKNKGLFIYNLREHIPSSLVDSAIDKTINKEPKNFWFYNNGITIACEDFRFDGNLIRLENFSIINGAQTTTRIGNSNNINESNDFFVVTKIIKTFGKDQDEFMSKISEASNSQKPIKFSDLKSNRREQRILQQKAMDNKPLDLAIKIKRGVTPSNHKKVEQSWKRIENVKLAQLMYAFFYQSPGLAKNSPRILFQQSEYYKKIFNPIDAEIDYDTLHDLVYLAYLYDEYKVERVNSLIADQSGSITEISFTKIALYTVVAMIGYLIKYKRGVITGYHDSKIYDFNINERLFDQEKEDFITILYSTFNFLINEVIIPTYNEFRKELNITSELNFLKSDSYYQEKLLSKIDKELDSYFKTETREKIFGILK